MTTTADAPAMRANLTTTCAGKNCTAPIGKNATLCYLCQAKQDKSRKDVAAKRERREAAREAAATNTPPRVCSAEGCTTILHHHNKSGVCTKCAKKELDRIEGLRRAAEKEARRAALPQNYCPCGTAIEPFGNNRPNESGLCSDCLKKSRTARYEATRRAKNAIASKYPQRDNLATARSTMPTPKAESAPNARLVAQNEADTHEQVKVPTETQKVVVSPAQQTAAQLRAERDCLTGLASMTAAIKDGRERFGGAPYELHCTPDLKDYTAHARGMEPKPGYRAIKRFYKDGMGRWQEAHIVGQRKTEEDED